MNKLNIDIIKALPFIDQTGFQAMVEEVTRQHNVLLSGSGKGKDYLGWLHLPSLVTPGLISKIREDAEKTKKHSEIVVIIGIGGSYLGARAVIEALGHHFQTLVRERKNPFILYSGQNLSEDYQSNLLEILDHYDYSIVVISKSGTTTEPAVAFRIIMAHLEKKYGRANAAERVFAITDASKGALVRMAHEKGFTTYVIPDDVGGRYSVLTPVGLLPVAIAGFDIEKLLSGAREMQERLFVSSMENPAIQYASIRNALYRNGKTVEIMVNYEPRLFYFMEWWKQLYGESEGKENKGIFPAGVSFTTDLHSLGQYIQEGLRNIFETVISVEKPDHALEVPFDEQDSDGLNFLSRKRISEINQTAELGTMLAHVDGGVPNIRITIPCVDEEILGQLIYFFEFSCALSGYTLGVNPFDQPGVEAYKKNMFALLGKPGFEKHTEELKKRL